MNRVAVVGPNRLHLGFTDGSEGTVDVTPWIAGRTGVFAALRDPGVFAQVHVDADAGTIVWPNGADLDPDVLYAAAHRAPADASGS